MATTKAQRKWRDKHRLVKSQLNVVAKKHVHDELGDFAGAFRLRGKGEAVTFAGRAGPPRSTSGGGAATGTTSATSSAPISEPPSKMAVSGEPCTLTSDVAASVAGASTPEPNTARSS